MYDNSRFARTGARHAMRLLDELDAVGVGLVGATDYVPRHEFSDLQEVHGALLSQWHAKRIGNNAARGQQSSLDKGTQSIGGPAPFAIDRIIVSADGKPAHRLRDRRDGQQLRMHPETDELLETYPPNQPGQSSSHFVKSKEQRVVLAPGDPEAIAIVHRIYRLHFLDRLGAPRIARALNDDAIPAPKGGEWHVNTVYAVLRNPVYTGRLICNRYARGIYYKRSPNMPTPVQNAPTYSSGQPAIHVRPREDWIVVDLPKLQEFLPEDIRETARRAHDRILAEDSTTRKPAPRRDKHGANEYILKGLLTSKQGGHTMTGYSSENRSKKKFRYYRVSKSSNRPRSGSILSKMVPADAIENAVLVQVRSVLLTAPIHLQRVVEQIMAWQRSRQTDNTDHRAVERDLHQIQASIDLVIQQAGLLGQDEATTRLERLTAQKRALQSKLAPADEWDELDENEVKAVAAAILRQFEDIGRGMGGLPLIEQRRLVEMFVESATVDLETMEAHIVVRFPNWAAIERRERGEFCLDSSSPWESGSETDRLSFVRIEFSVEIPSRRWRRRAA